MGFILYFTLRDLLAVPSEQNDFVSPQLEYSNSLAVARNLAGNGLHRVLRQLAFCCFKCCPFCSMSFFIT